MAQPDFVVVDDGRQVLEYVVTEPAVALLVRHDVQSLTTTTSSITELLFELLASYLTGGQQSLVEEAVVQT